MGDNTINIYGYRVWLRSRPGFYEQYNGHVDVTASNDTEAVDHAFNKLKRDSFPDRNRSMWIVEKVEKHEEG